MYVNLLSVWRVLDVRPHMEQATWYAATQLIQLSFSAISLPHSICWVWPNAHAHTSDKPADINIGIMKHYKAVYLQNILLYFRKSSGFWTYSFQRGTFSLEVWSVEAGDPKGWRWGGPCCMTQGCWGAWRSPPPALYRQGQCPQPQSLSCFFSYIFLQKWLEKGCIKNTIHHVILFI